MTATPAGSTGILLTLDPGPAPIAGVSAAPSPTAMTVTVGPRNAHTDPATGLRYYRWGTRDLPSVTSVRRLAGMPFALVNWQLTQVIDHAVTHVKDISTRLASKDPGQVALIRAELRAASTKERDAKAKLGTAVHDAAAEGKGLTEVPADVAARLQHYLQWLVVSRAEVLASEFQVFNLTVGYAGTADLLVRFPNGAVWLIDLKTSKGAYSETALQLIAYTKAEIVGADNVVDERLTALLHEVQGMAILHLSETAWKFIAVRPDDETWRAFRGLLAFATWMKDHERIESVTVGVRSGSATEAA